MAKKDYESRTEQLLMPIITAGGYELVDVEWVKEGGTWYLRVYADKEGGITINDCETISRALSDLLDKEDFISENYILEVSSPGIDRPLTKPNHFKRFKGFEAKIETIEEVEKRKRIKGVISDVDEKDNIHINMENKEFVVAFDNIAKAKLVLTDELLDAFEKAAENEDNEL